MNGVRLQAFSETKRRIVDAIDHRIDMLKTLISNLENEGHRIGYQLIITENAGRLDELETFRKFVKGMVIETKQGAEK